MKGSIIVHLILVLCWKLLVYASVGMIISDLLIALDCPVKTLWSWKALTDCYLDICGYASRSSFICQILFLTRGFLFLKKQAADLLL